MGQEHFLELLWSGHIPDVITKYLLLDGRFLGNFFLKYCTTNLYAKLCQMLSSRQESQLTNIVFILESVNEFVGKSIFLFDGRML